MKIGILGAGAVGQAFARAVLPHGHEVIFSSRNPDRQEIRDLEKSFDGQVKVTSIEGTIAFGDILVIAMHWKEAKTLVTHGDWTGKIVIDLMNPRDDTLPASSAEALADMLPSARLVKAFNCIGAEHYPDPIFEGQAATMLVAADDPDAKQTVITLSNEMGFDTIDVGDLSSSIILEYFALVWIHLAFRTGEGRNIGFKLLRK